ncbi:MAG: hypothetical protein AABX72_00600 [Nanoarchaeota archaeon]
MATAVVSKNFVDELVKNNITLQKATIELIDAVNRMTDRTDRILSLFEEAAKNIEMADIKEPLGKQLETLLEQNKAIARGLVLLERYVREKGSFGVSSYDKTKPLPRV